MKLTPTPQSSNIAGHGHDPETSTLLIQFKNGAVHKYEGVTAEDYAALAGAESVGKHFYAEIRGKFSSSRYDGELEA